MYKTIAARSAQPIHSRDRFGSSLMPSSHAVSHQGQLATSALSVKPVQQRYSQRRERRQPNQDVSSSAHAVILAAVRRPATITGQVIISQVVIGDDRAVAHPADGDVSPVAGLTRFASDGDEK
jgi:hypothetical protein